MLLTPAEIRDAILIALGSLHTNKFRSFLTVLGVMIGVSSVIALASVINGLDRAVEAEIDSLGSNYIRITHLPENVDWDNLPDSMRNRPYIKSGEARAIQANCPAVAGVSPENHYWRPGGNIVKFKNRKANQPAIVGTWPPFLAVHDIGIARGRFLSWTDVDRRSMVCVIGKDIEEGCFENADAIGQELRVNGSRFQVIGVFARRKSNLDDDPLENRKVIIPLSTFEKMYPWDEALTLTARAQSLDDMDEALEQIIGTLRIHRKVPFGAPNNFEVATQETYREQYGKISKYIYLAMIVITSVGLMVGGIGVMNIMLVSVTERTREIGVRKAIGAKRSNIVLQFLTEAVTLSGSGGVIGVLFGIIVGLALNSAFGFPLGVSIFWIALGFLVAVSVGLVSGLYPAVKASRLDPIEALRYE
jgi:putative ABC transport system permease protein